MTLDVELIKNDSIKRLFVKSFSKATIWVYDQFIRWSNSNVCLARALFSGWKCFIMWKCFIKLMCSVRLPQSAVKMTTSLITALLELILKRIGANFWISTLTTFVKIAIKILEACSTGKTACFETFVTGVTVTDKMRYCATSWKKR